MPLDVNKRVLHLASCRDDRQRLPFRSHLMNLLLIFLFSALVCRLPSPDFPLHLPLAALHSTQSTSSHHSHRLWSAAPFPSSRYSCSAGRIGIATPQITTPIASHKYGVLGWEHRNYLNHDSPDMVLTRQGYSPRDPDKFPTAQLLLLGQSICRLPCSTPCVG